jgi:hypothetical protein
MAKKITGKEWYFSKTILIAVAMGVIGVIDAVLAVNPELKAVGIIAVIKSVIDFWVRLNTSEPIK